MHFGSPGDGGSTFGHVRAALEFTFLNSAVDANGERPALVRAYTHASRDYPDVKGAPAMYKHATAPVIQHIPALVSVVARSIAGGATGG